MKRLIGLFVFVVAMIGSYFTFSEADADLGDGQKAVVSAAKDNGNDAGGDSAGEYGDGESACGNAQESDGGGNGSGRGDKVADDDRLEVPVSPSGINERILERMGYVTSYNADTRQPNWVAWCLTERRTMGGSKRSECSFTADEEVPAPRAEDRDYRSSGYDRGHMCPAGDNKWDMEAMRQSFLFTNICPQAPQLNRGDWNEMEMACRKWAAKYGKLYVVCGPIFYKGKKKTIGINRVAVPNAFFKVVLRLGDSPRAIGFIYKNEDGNRPKGDYANSVDQVERITGIDFFPNLPDDVEQRVESVCNPDDWDI